eukprot:TRINITY_DN26723_c0_g1_i1.p1 TRINITY_DN26723_c0_g1~~TRINITY_DN26723_c0_g1_i1.p1  ORF type:complete len:939 (-),score=248.54 TRINITY_DN26723_c0_g1_i1:601-3417(-)
MRLEKERVTGVEMDIQAFMDELDITEAKVTALSTIIRELEADREGFCTNCFIHLRQRLRALHAQYMPAGSPARIADGSETKQETLSEKLKRQSAAHQALVNGGFSDASEALHGLSLANGVGNGGPRNGKSVVESKSSRGAGRSSNGPVNARGRPLSPLVPDEGDDEGAGIERAGAIAERRRAPDGEAHEQGSDVGEVPSDNMEDLRGEGGRPGQPRPPSRGGRPVHQPLAAALKSANDSRTVEGLLPVKLGTERQGGLGGVNGRTMSGGGGGAARVGAHQSVSPPPTDTGGGHGRAGRGQSRAVESPAGAEDGGGGQVAEGYSPAPAEELSQEDLQALKREELLMKERKNMARVVQRKGLVCNERVNGKQVNILEGLELHENVFGPKEQQSLVNFVNELQEKGRRGELKERTYTAPRKTMKGKGRVTIQLGCCYNYIPDNVGQPAGIARKAEVDPMPPLLKNTIKRLIRWHVLPASCIPDSCIINIYEVDDCIPPHIDHHDFVRPFCTLSLLCEAPIVFGHALKILAPGEFGGAAQLMLPPGSVLVLQGNGADLAKHAVPAVKSRRISITFRRMDPSKRPLGFTPDVDLASVVPLKLADGAPPPPPQLVSYAAAATSAGDVRRQQQNQQQQQADLASPGAGSSSVGASGNGEQRGGGSAPPWAGNRLANRLGPPPSGGASPQVSSLYNGSPAMMIPSGVGDSPAMDYGMTTSGGSPAMLYAEDGPPPPHGFSDNSSGNYQSPNANFSPAPDGYDGSVSDSSFPPLEGGMSPSMGNGRQQDRGARAGLSLSPLATAFVPQFIPQMPSNQQQQMMMQQQMQQQQQGSPASYHSEYPPAYGPGGMHLMPEHTEEYMMYAPNPMMELISVVPQGQGGLNEMEERELLGIGAGSPGMGVAGGPPWATSTPVLHWGDEDPEEEWNPEDFEVPSSVDEDEMPING